MNSQPDISSSPARTIIFAINPNSGATDRRSLCESIARRLGDEGFAPILLTDLSEVRQQTQEHLDAGTLRAVVAAGGDGTIAVLANLLPRETPFAILPLGTENLLGRHLGLIADEDFFVSLIKTGEEHRIDAGRANGKLFFVVASCGFDAAVVKRLDEVRTGHINYFSWLKPIFQTIVSYRFPKLNFFVDGTETAWSARWAFVFNIPRYAINLRITPEADDRDGKLDMCTYRDGGILRGVWYLITTFVGGHPRLNSTRFAQFRSLRVEAEGDEPVHFELDGDPGGVLPLEIVVVPEALRVLVPNRPNVSATPCD
ncbi:diacylglycerol/lipid kinase family protein [Mariniblastus fucicola]|uniref:Diacylglycerol kinase n=1 Tax=Mariniblastus fucicola TaxID=980251 RepID=A0A5B9PF31_9BACT|nr:diacylglycerol kinase family protein [Mariniblastus fucicola]QEG23226.1 Diacylglycerol kinase [Mariniblastus fucicola]